MRKSYKIIWRPESLEQLKSIRKYIAQDSLFAADKIVNKIRTKVKLLKKDPFVGQKEESLKKYNVDHRYLVIGNYKIIYSLDFLLLFYQDNGAALMNTSFKII